MFGRTWGAVKAKRMRLGLTMSRDDWDEEQIKFLYANYMVMSDAKVGQELGKTEYAIRSKRMRLGGEIASKGHVVQRLPAGVSVMRRILAQYKRDAENRDFEWHLTEDQFVFLTQKPCQYCGREPHITRVTKDSNGSYTYNGIDRIDSELGYVVGNVVPCCKRCNVAKGAGSLDDFLDWAIDLYEHLVEDAQAGFGIRDKPILLDEIERQAKRGAGTLALDW